MNRHALIIENNPDDAFFIKWAFRDAPTFSSCYVCRNLAEARAYVKGVGIYGDRVKFPEPSAIVCDYRLPDGTGADLLQSFRQENLVRDIPFCFLTGSATPDELERLAPLEPTAIYKKSVSFFELCRVMGGIPALVEEARPEHASF